MWLHRSCFSACSVSFQEKNYMADSIAADLMAGLLPVQEASPEARFVMGLEYFSPVRATGSRRVLDVQKFVDRQKVDDAHAGSPEMPTLSASGEVADTTNERRSDE